MARNYEVSIDGLDVRITEGPADAARPTEGLLLAAGPSDRVADMVERARRLPGLGRLTLVCPDAQRAWDAFRAGYEPVEAAGGAVTDEEGRLLAIHRLGRWDLPKGKVDPGEALPDAAAREVREECGLRAVEVVRPLCETWHTYVRRDRRHLKRTSWFLMRAAGSEPLRPQLEEDIDEVRWMDGPAVERMRADTYGTVRAVVSAWEAAVARSRT